MARQKKETFGQNFKRFFLRGLAILLPSVLTVWLLLAAYLFVHETIAEPINTGVRELILRMSAFPDVTDTEMDTFRNNLQQQDPRLYSRWAARGYDRAELRLRTRRDKLEDLWDESPFPLDLVGVILAVVLIYLIGGLLGSFIGRQLYHRGEQLMARVPLIRSVYPSIKQVTDFFVGERPEGAKFNRVVAVEYPRKGTWSIGLVTGDTMRTIEDTAGKRCVTVFIPSSPTPFTGYVLTVPVEDMVDLPITIDDAIRFTISGGVVVPPGEVIVHGRAIGALTSDRDPAGQSAAAAPPRPQGKPSGREQKK